MFPSSATIVFASLEKSSESTLNFLLHTVWCRWLNHSHRLDSISEIEIWILFPVAFVDVVVVVFFSS